MPEEALRNSLACTVGQLSPEPGVRRDLLDHGAHRTVILTVIILAINVVANKENPDNYCHDFH
jgi:hypothetical protein